MTKKKAAKKKSSKPPTTKRRRIPRQEVLPGVGDVKIAAIENAALDYAEIRDQRQELTTQEVDLKKKLLDLMHAKDITVYKRNRISVTVQMEEETVKVRVRAEEDSDEEPETNVGVSEQTEESEAQPD